MIVLGDPPEAWEALGFTVEAGIVALGEERLHLSGRGGGILPIMFLDSFYPGKETEKPAENVFLVKLGLISTRR